MYSEAILTKIKNRKEWIKLHYINNRERLSLKERIKYHLKRNREIVLNLLEPQELDERKVFTYKDREYIKRCEWWYLDNVDIKYIMNTNIIKPTKLTERTIRKALERIKDWEKVGTVANMYNVWPQYFYYFINNPNKFNEKV